MTGRSSDVTTGTNKKCQMKNHSRLATLACFQKNAGVNIAKSMAPMVAWSSARREAVCGRRCQFYKGRGRRMSTHVVARSDPAIPGRRFVAMRRPDILESPASRQTYCGASTGTRPRNLKARPRGNIPTAPPIHVALRKRLRCHALRPRRVRMKMV